MAFYNQAQSRNNNNQPIGYLNNLSVVDANGKEHRIGVKGLPLYVQKEIQNALVEAAKTDPDKVFKFTATIKPYAPEQLPEDLKL